MCVRLEKANLNFKSKYILSCFAVRGSVFVCACAVECHNLAFKMESTKFKDFQTETQKKKKQLRMKRKKLKKEWAR